MGVNEMSEWKVIEQEMLELPSGFTAILKISVSDLDQRISVSLGSGKFFLPMQESDLDAIAEALKAVKVRCKEIREGKPDFAQKILKEKA